MVVSENFNVSVALVSVSQVTAFFGAISGWRFTTIVLLQKRYDFAA
jgi:hypothetical protein